MNTTTRIGKIARLPHSIREQLNLRLNDGLPGKTILPWLNSLPEVKAILAADFDNHPVNKQNLSEWRQGGFRDWFLQFHASQFLCNADIPVGAVSNRGNEAQTPPSERPSASDDSNDKRQCNPDQVGTLSPSDGERVRGEGPHAEDLTNEFTHHASRLTSKLLLWAQLQYTVMARQIDAETDPERKWNALRQFANDISRLRRSTLADDFLQIQRDWLALSQSNSIEKKELEFCKWIKRPDIADAIKNKRRGITREQLRKIEEEDLYLTGPDDHDLDEHIARVRLAKELMARRKAKEAEAKRQPGDPIPQPPEIKLRDTTLEELFPSIPDNPLTELDYQSQSNPDIPVGAVGPTPAATSGDQPNGFPLPKGEGERTIHQPSAQYPAPSHSSDQSRQSNPVKPSQIQSNQIQPDSPINLQQNPINAPTPPVASDQEFD